MGYSVLTSHVCNPLSHLSVTQLQVLSYVVHYLSPVVGCTLTPPCGEGGGIRERGEEGREGVRNYTDQTHACHKCGCNGRRVFSPWSCFVSSLHSLTDVLAVALGNLAHYRTACPPDRSTVRSIWSLLTPSNIHLKCTVNTGSVCVCVCA